MYKVIAIDLDGTLLNDEKEISKENIYWINKAYKEKGIIPVITTGRTISSAEHCISIVGKDIMEYVIAQNGAIVKDIIKNKYIKFETFKKETIKKSVKILKKHNLKVSMETDKYVLQDHEKTDGEIALSEKLGNEIKTIEDIENYNFNDDDITTVTGAGDKKNLENASLELEKLEDILLVPVSKWLAKHNGNVYKGYYLEFMAQGVSKGNGIVTLLNHLEIDSKEVIVIGDGPNDTSMFEIGALSVAMGNGDENLKSKADYITTTNNENGVAKVIQKYIFNI